MSIARTLRSAVTALSAALALCFAPQAIAQSTTTITDSGVYDVHRVFGSGLYDSTAGQTFVTFAGPEMDVYVRAYTHSTGTWGSNIRIRNNSYTTASAYHNYPVMVRAPNGRIVVFYFNHNSNLYQLTSPNPNSIAGTWSFKEIGPVDATPGYPTPIVAGSNMYLFYRQTIGNIYRPLYYIKSADSGATWSAPRVAIDTQDLQSDNLDEVYPDDIGYDNGLVRITWHLAGGPGHNVQTKNVYFTYFNPSNDTFVSVNNTPLGSSIDASDFALQTSNRILVREALPSTGIAQPIPGRLPSRPIRNQSNRPLVGYNFVDASGLAGYTAAWNGTSWVNRRLQENGVPIPGTLGDFQPTTGDAIRVLLIDQTNYVLRLKQTVDGGATWTSVWTLPVAANMINGADRIGYTNALASAEQPVDFLVATFNFAQRQQDYTGTWRIFTVQD